jgi:hypothetical protein
MANRHHGPRKKTVKSFTTQTRIEIIIPQADPTLQPLEATQEGLQND